MTNVIYEYYLYELIFKRILLIEREIWEEENVIMVHCLSPSSTKMKNWCFKSIGEKNSYFSSYLSGYFLPQEDYVSREKLKIVRKKDCPHCERRFFCLFSSEKNARFTTGRLQDIIRKTRFTSGRQDIIRKTRLTNGRLQDIVRKTRFTTGRLQDVVPFSVRYL